MTWASEYVGVPFRDGGRDRDGLDCWGLIRLVLQEQCGVTLPSYDTLPAADLLGVARELKRQAAGGPYLEVRQPVEFDIALMLGVVVDETGRGHHAPVHVGVIAPGNRLLHVERGTDTVCVALNNRTVRNRLKGFYRVAVLAGAMNGAIR